MPSVSLPDLGGKTDLYVLQGEPVKAKKRSPARARVAMAAAHVVVDPFADAQPGEATAIDWDATLSIRRHLADLGLGIAEAMDTAQRGMGLGWEEALELIRRSNEGLSGYEGLPIYSGCSTDNLEAGRAASLDEVKSAYLRQIEEVQQAGGRVIVMASRSLAAASSGPECYAEVYRTALQACDEPAILHWLGEAFDPALKGYWGSDDMEEAGNCCLEIISENQDKVDGIKLSVLDKHFEISLRERLPQGVRMYTGDDFDYPELIVGDEKGHSDALLGILGPIAPVASEALAALDAGDSDRCLERLESTVGLSRHIFSKPTYHYKTGVAFLAWLNGLQDHFVMLAGAQSMRPLPYFTKLFRLADQCGLLADPDLAVSRMETLLAQHGFAR